MREQIAELLENEGWLALSVGAGSAWQCLVAGFADAGQFSDGARVVRLALDERGRYLERLDGWGMVEKDVDLREFEGDPVGAVKAVLGPAVPRFVVAKINL